ncbi:MAG: hypothetical protein NUV65_02200 [Candidatus Roizmanbacteria bacterium]|nr:hypothetical protein [Candidatus Roizmanbacteria bacterium]
MSVDNLRRRFTHIFLSAMIALTISSCVDRQNSLDEATPPCLPVEWVQLIPRGDFTYIGSVIVMNSGGELIVDPNTRNQPTVKDGNIVMTTNDGVQVAVNPDNNLMLFNQGLAHYFIYPQQEPYDSIRATVIKTCDQAI